ncbi:unnamed protein product [Chrysoparadoxa australica]
MVFHYGTLRKKKLLLWKERFFVLRGTTLSIFRKKGDAEPGRVIQLSVSCSIEKGATKGSGFLLRTPGKALRLKGDSEKEEHEWFTVIDGLLKSEHEKVTLRPQRSNTRLWWAETKQGQFCFELDEHYEMRKTIGSGGYGVVVSAVDRKSEKTVAVKKVVQAFDDVLVAKRMAREVRLMRQFDHNNIVSLVDMLPPPNVENFEDIYLVLERMDTDLHHIIYMGQTLKEAHIQFFLYQILCGLKYIHSAGVLHRDIKPANILVNTTCDLKLCDFGLARSIEQKGEGADALKMTEYVVTRWWRAPEVFLEAGYGAGVDVWSAGCILAEMLQKKPLFMGKNTTQMLRLILRFCGKQKEADLQFVQNEKALAYLRDVPCGAPINLQDKFEGVEPLGLDLLQKMLVFNPEKRMSVDEALEHPWLARFHHPDNEKVATRPARLDEVEEVPLKRAALQQLVFEDVCTFRPECSFDSVDDVDTPTTTPGLTPDASSCHNHSSIAGLRSACPSSVIVSGLTPKISEAAMARNKITPRTLPIQTLPVAPPG